MARFLAYDDVAQYDLMRPTDIQWLAGQISTLPAFQQGSAIVCGSVVWGTHCWRSDIDIAHFRTNSYPTIKADIEGIVANFHDRTGRRFICPRIDIAVIGEESSSLAGFADSKNRKREETGNLSIVGPPSSIELEGGAGPRVFADVFERFRDHIGSIAELKGQPWRDFYIRYLSDDQRPRYEHRESISAYVSAVSEAWSHQPLHPLGRGADGSFTSRQLDLLSQAENYPVNLMRRLLAAMDNYPHPDRKSEIWAAFLQVPAPWAEKIIAAVPAFSALTELYESLVTACKQSGTRPTREQFHEQLELAAAQLPFSAIQEAIWEYLRT